MTKDKKKTMHTRKNLFRRNYILDIRKLVPLFAFIVILGSGFFGHSLINAMAEEPKPPVPAMYYKSIEIEEGDTLWGIASEYAAETGISIPEYVNLLKQMNNLADDTIHEGYHLTVRYCASSQ